ncbi:MAG: InlB B-repeat-containing protein [Eubacteriaceae bacterium]|jgi:uncharacterized repeat protein (TIGR02543 family)|nr:InlB B-repeat-containing protein [Eubacteriaceae bacterium]
MYVCKVRKAIAMLAAVVMVFVMSAGYCGTVSYAAAQTAQSNKVYITAANPYPLRCASKQGYEFNETQNPVFSGYTAFTKESLLTAAKYQSFDADGAVIPNSEVTVDETALKELNAAIALKYAYFENNNITSQDFPIKITSPNDVVKTFTVRIMRGGDVAVYQTAVPKLKTSSCRYDIANGPLTWDQLKASDMGNVYGYYPEKPNNTWYKTHVPDTIGVEKYIDELNAAIEAGKTGDYTVYALWAPSDNNFYDVAPFTVTLYKSIFTVSFDSQGGSAVGPIKDVKTGSTITRPADPTYRGFIFDGWYTEPTGGVKYDFSTPVTADLTLYAHWAANTVTPAESYRITTSSSANGTIDPSCTVGKGGTKTINYKANDGYKLTGLTVDGAAVDITRYPDSYTFTNITADHSITASYAKEGASPAAAERPFIMLKTIDKGTTMNLSWIRTKGATKYIIYGNYCSNKTHQYRYKKIKTISSGDITKYRISGRVRGYNYKYRVTAYQGSRKLCTSNTTHTACGSHLGYFNAVRVYADKTKVSVTAGHTVKVTGKVTTYSGRAMLYKTHCAKVRYLSRNTDIAAVTSRGVIRGVSAGTTTVYVYSPNGIRKAVKVTVK